jgi:hypothetical protein
MLKSALIFGAVAFLVGLAVTFFSPVCVPCLAIFMGLGAGYLAGVFSKPSETGAAAQSGGAAGAISALGALAGQMIGGMINAVFMGPEQALAALRRLANLPATAGSTAPNSYYYFGALGFPCCAGLFDIGLMALLGAAGALLWLRLVGMAARKSAPPAAPASQV